jgi:hypothetical protein
VFKDAILGSVTGETAVIYRTQIECRQGDGARGIRTRSPGRRWPGLDDDDATDNTYSTDTKSPPRGGRALSFLYHSSPSFVTLQSPSPHS